jgi:Ca-activated chloride channel family protein
MLQRREDERHVFTEKDRNSTFYANIIPAFDCGPGEIVKRELIFVLDRSGSMEGEPVEQAKISLKKALRTLRSGDIFNIITFNYRQDRLSERSLELNEANLMVADNFIDSVRASGGTEILAAMNCAFDTPSSKHYLRQIVFLTDGAVGDEYLY